RASLREKPSAYTAPKRWCSRGSERAVIRAGTMARSSLRLSSTAALLISISLDDWRNVSRWSGTIEELSFTSCGESSSPPTRHDRKASLSTSSATVEGRDHRLASL